MIATLTAGLLLGNRHFGLHNGLEKLRNDLVLARFENASDFDKFAWRAYHLASEATDDKTWATVKASLLSQGFKIKEDGGGWGEETVNISLPELNFPLANHLSFDFNIRLSVKPLISEDTPTTFQTRFLWATLAVEPNVTFAAQLKNPIFPDGSVIAKILRRPGLLQDSKVLPNLVRVEERYDRPYLGRSVDYGGEPPFMPYRLRIEVELGGKNQSYRQSGIKYAAESHLDPLLRVTTKATKPQPAGLPAFGEPVDEFGSENAAISQGQLGFDRDHSFLWMIDQPQSEATFDLFQKMPWVYSRADLLTLPESTEKLEIFAEKFPGKNWSLIKRLANLKVLDFTGSPMSDTTESDLCHIGELSNLEEISVGSDVVGDRLATSLSRLKHLSKVRLGGKQLTDQGIMALAAMPSVRKLYLIWAKSMSDRSLLAISQNKNITGLSLPREGRFTGAGIAKLATLKNLTSISLSGVGKVSPKSLMFLKDLKQLEEVDLENGTVDRQLIAALATLPKLTMLNFENVKGLTNDALMSLKGMKSLETLQISDCKGVTSDGIERLRQAMPRKYYTSVNPK